MSEEAVSRNTVNQITSGITESMGSPSQGIPTSSTQAALMNIILRMIEEDRIGLEMLAKLYGHRLVEGEYVNNSVREERLPIESIAKEAGMPFQEVLEELDEILPFIVDKFTPDGKTPDIATIRQAASLLRTKIA